LETKMAYLWCFLDRYKIEKEGTGNEGRIMSLILGMLILKFKREYLSDSV
jgi:hypothetical protein